MVVHQLDPYKVQEIRTLGKSDDAKAHVLLEQVAKQVQPIMRRRQYTCPLLTEMFPQQAALLGLNIGGGGGGTSEIRIRLRLAGRPAEFLPYESVLATMLHELTHNIRSPHDAQFYRLLDELKQECEELMAKGVSGTGEGFDAPAAGNVGGRFVGSDLPHHQRRDLAIKAAEERARRLAVMPGGPLRLGGDLTLRQVCDPREAAAIAAERRARDEIWCPAERLAREAAAGHSVDSAIQAILTQANGGGGDTGSDGSEGGGGAGPAAGRSTGDLQEQEQKQQQGQQQQEQRQDYAQPVPDDGPRRGELAEPQQAAPRMGARGGSLRSRVRAVLAGEPLPPDATPAAEHNCGQQLQLQDGQLFEPLPVPAAAEAAEAGGVLSTGGDALPPALLATAPDAPAALLPPIACAALPASELPAVAPSPAAAVEQAADADVVDLTLDSDAEEGFPPAPPKRLRMGGSGEWACPACTLINRPLALACNACGGTRPAGFQ